MATLSLSGPTTALYAFLNGAYSLTAAASGGTTPYTYSAVGLPDGLSINSTSGVISGTATETGTYSVTVSVSDSAATPANATYSTSIRVLSSGINGVPPDALVGSKWAFTPTLANSTTGGTVTLSLDSNTALPAGLSFSSANSNITGTPTTVGSATINLIANYSSTGNTSVSTVPFTIAVYAALSISGKAPLGYLGNAYTFTPTVSGGNTKNLVFTATNLPGGISIDSRTGKLTGTPNALGDSNTTITVTDQSYANSNTYRLSIVNPVSLSGTVSAGYIGSAYTFTPTISNAATGGSVYVTLTTGTLPAGLTLATKTGVISGTPNTAGTSSFTLTVTDGTSTSITSYKIVVYNALTVSGSMPVGYVGKAYSYTPTVTGGTGTYTYSQTGLPSTLTINAGTGAITGTPTAAFSGQVSVIVSDGNTSTTLNVSLIISNGVTLYGAPGIAYIGNSYSFTPSVTGMASGGKLTVVLKSGSSLPAGLSLSATTGAITGTPTAASNTPFTLTASDGTTSNDTTFTVTVTPPISITGSPAAAEIGIAYSFRPTVTNPTPNSVVTFSLSTGALPAGLTLNPNTGVISGTPTIVSSAIVVLQVSDGVNVSTLTTTFTVLSAMTITGTLPGRLIGKLWSFTPTVVGGQAGSYQYSLANLPDNTVFPLSINASTGTITGTPTAVGTYSVTLVVNDGIGTVSQALDISVPVLGIVNTAIEGVCKLPYLFVPQTVGGSGNYTYSLDKPLVTGLQFDPNTGIISGTVETPNFYDYVLTVNDGVNTAETYLAILFVKKRTNTVAYLPQHYTGWKKGSPASYVSYTQGAAGSKLPGFITLGYPAGIGSNNWGYGCLRAPIADSNGTATTVNDFWVTTQCNLVTGYWSRVYFNGNGGTNIGYRYAVDFSNANNSGLIVLHASNSNYICLRLVNGQSSTGVFVTQTYQYGVYIGTTLSDPSSMTDTGLRISMNPTPTNDVVGGGIGALVFDTSAVTLRINGGGTTNGTIRLYVSSTIATVTNSTWTGDLTSLKDFHSVSLHNPAPSTLTTGISSNWVTQTFQYYTQVNFLVVTSYNSRNSNIQVTYASAQGSLAQWSGSLTPYSAWPVAYGNLSGRIATADGQQDSYKFKDTITLTTGTEVKAVKLTGFAMTDDDSTSAALSMIVRNPTTLVTMGQGSMKGISSDGSTVTTMWNSDPLAYNDWTVDAVNNYEFGFSRTPAASPD